MPLRTRFEVAAKGAVLWVLFGLALGLLAAMVHPTETTLAVPWVSAGMGILGAVAHVAVTLVKPSLEQSSSTTASIAIVSITLVLAFVYWVVGVPGSSLGGIIKRDYQLILLLVVAPMVLLSWLVLRLVSPRGAA